MTINQPFTQTVSVQRKIVRDDFDDICYLPPLPPIILPSKLVILSELIEITNFKAKAFVSKSLNAVNLPAVSLEMSRAEESAALYQFEWDSPRIGLSLLKFKGNDFINCGIYSLVNINPLPFRDYDLLSLYKGAEGTESVFHGDYWFALQLQDLGQGFLKEDDSISIVLDAKISYYTYEEATPAVIINQLTTIEPKSTDPIITMFNPTLIVGNVASIQTNRALQFSDYGVYAACIKLAFNSGIAYGSKIQVNKWNEQPTFDTNLQNTAGKTWLAEFSHYKGSSKIVFTDEITLAYKYLSILVQPPGSTWWYKAYVSAGFVNSILEITITGLFMEEG